MTDTRIVGRAYRLAPPLRLRPLRSGRLTRAERLLASLAAQEYGRLVNSTASAAGAESGSNRWAILALLGVAQLMVVLDATIVNIALPSAQRALGFSTDSRQWVVTAYALSVRQPAVARRQARRSVWTKVDVHRWADRFRDGFGDRRVGPVFRDARCRARVAGRVRRAARALRAVAVDGHVRRLAAIARRRSASSGRSPAVARRSGWSSVGCSRRRCPGGGACTSTC